MKALKYVAAAVALYLLFSAGMGVADAVASVRASVNHSANQEA